MLTRGTGRSTSQGEIVYSINAWKIMEIVQLFLYQRNPWESWQDINKIHVLVSWGYTDMYSHPTILVIPGEEYDGCWWPGSLCHQDIISHGIDCARYSWVQLQCGEIYHGVIYNNAMTAAEYASNFELIKDIPYLTLTSELWGEMMRKCTLCINSVTWYRLLSQHQLR